jgi:hypothetical protein
VALQDSVERIFVSSLSFKFKAPLSVCIMSVDVLTNHVTRLLDCSFGCQTATTSPSTPPIIGGAFSQGTLSPASRGVIIVGYVGFESPEFLSIERGGLEETF